MSAPFTKKPPIIRACTKKCKHPYQDQKYGNGMRVMNPQKKDDMYKCSVCGTEQYE